MDTLVYGVRTDDHVQNKLPYIANCSWWKTFADTESNPIRWKTFMVDR